jgi:hypothetical protein
VADSDEVIRDLPEVLFPRHPAECVEKGEIERPRVPAQRLLPSQVEVTLDVREHEVADGQEERLAKTETGVVRPRDRTPQAVAPVESEDVVVVEDGLEVEDEWRLALNAQSRGREERAVHALHLPLAQDPPRGAASLAANVVVELVQKLLDPPGRGQAPQPAGFRCSKSEIGARWQRRL